MIFIKTKTDLSTLSNLIYQKLGNTQIKSYQHRESLNRGGEYVFYETHEGEIYLCHNNEESSPSEEFDFWDYHVYTRNLKSNLDIENQIEKSLKESDIIDSYEIKSW